MKKITGSLNSPVYAIDCFFQGAKLLFRAELRKYILIPICINIVLYSIAILLGYYFIYDLVVQFIPSWLEWLEWLIWPLFIFSFSIIIFFSFTLFANILAAPFYNQLSIKTMALISGEPRGVNEQKVSAVFFAEIKRGGYIISRMVPLLILFIIPGINLIAPFLWGLFGAWAMGLEYMAYPLENQGILFSEQRKQAKTRRMGVIGFGGIVIFGLSVPIVNLFVAPAAVIGATIYFYKLSE